MIAVNGNASNTGMLFGQGMITSEGIILITEPSQQKLLSHAAAAAQVPQ